MNQYHSIFDTIFAPIMLLCFGQALMSIVLLLRNRKKQFTNYLLALWCLVWGMSCYFFFGYIIGPQYLSLEARTLLGSVIPLMLFPPLYLYIYYFCYDLKKFRTKDLLHFTPLFAYIIFMTVLYIQAGSVLGIRELPIYRYKSITVSYVAAVQGIAYFIASNRVIKKWRLKLMQEYSNIEKIKLDWLQHLNYLSLLVMASGNISTFVKSTMFSPYLFYILYHVFMGIALYYVSFKTMLNPIIFSGEVPRPQLEKEEQKNKSIIGSEIIDRLDNLMDRDKLYINQDLNLQDLSKALNISRNQLSYALNNYKNQNFYDYIHSLRLGEAKARMLDSKYAHYSIISIAYDSGFNSKTVFYRIFKETENITPSEYRKKYADFSAKIAE